VAYLIKGAESFLGALMVDTLQHHTLAWVWITPRMRRLGIFRAIWQKLESYHRGFRVLAPLSAAMSAFFSREDTRGIHEIVTETGK
jgi:hypothetical protein